MSADARTPRRMQAVQAPVIPIVGELIKNHPGAISLGQGVVHYGPPPQAEQALGRFLADPDNHKYKLVQGIPPLLEALDAKLIQENGFQPTPERALVVTAGGNMAFMNALLAIADPGDEIILQTPYYFNHEMAVVLAGCRTVLVETDAEYQPRPQAIRQAVTSKTRAVVTISPNNPTGAVYSEETLREINSLCRERGIYHIHDEAYEYFTYDGARHFSPGAIPASQAHTISLFSMSKAYGFASWRIGYMTIPEHLLVSVKKIQDTLLICPPVICQFAALGALEAGKPYCLAKLEKIAEVRRKVLAELQTIRSICTVPLTHGAFYFLLKLRTDLDPMRLVEMLVQRYAVAAIPGTAFGMNRGCHLRVAYAALEGKLAAQGIERLVRGLRELI